MKSDLERLVEASKTLRPLVRAMTNDLGVDPEDLLHDAIIRALSKIKRGEEIGDYRAYLRRIMLSDLGHLRKQVMRRNEAHRFLARIISMMDMNDSLVLTVEARDLLRAAHELLTFEQARIYFLHASGYTNSEIANMLGRTRAAVSSSLYRSRVTLKPYLSDTSDEDPDVPSSLNNYFAAIAGEDVPTERTVLTQTESAASLNSTETPVRPPDHVDVREVVSARAERNQ